MPWYSKIFNPSKTIKSGTTEKVLGLSDDLGNFLMYGSSKGGGTPAGAIALYETSTAVSIPINFVAEAFASIDPVIKDGDVIVKDHPILELLAMPSPFFSRTLFLEALGKDYLITGEAGLVALGGLSRPPLELQPIGARNVSVVEGSNGTPHKFVIAGTTLTGHYMQKLSGTKRARYLSGGLREFKQIRSYSTKHNSLLRGQSKLLAASAEARQHILGSTHNLSLLEKGGRVSLVFHFEEDLDETVFAAVKENIRLQFGGAQNAGQVGITAGGKMKVEELGKTNKDMDFAKLQALAQTSVALQYKVPLPLVSNDKSTFSNLGSAMTMLYDNATLPLADTIFAGLTSLLMPRFGLDPAKVKITYDLDSITALKQRRIEEIKIRKEIALETINELRALLGRDAVLGADEILIPSGVIPVSKVGVEDSAQPAFAEEMTVNEKREFDGLEPVVGGDAIYKPSSQIPAIEIEES